MGPQLFGEGFRERLLAFPAGQRVATALLRLVTSELPDTTPQFEPLTLWQGWQDHLRAVISGGASDRLPYSLTMAHRGPGTLVLNAALRSFLLDIHDPLRGSTVELAAPAAGAMDLGKILSFDGMVGYGANVKFAKPLVQAGYTFQRFPLPPAARANLLADWPTLFPMVVRKLCMNPDLMKPQVKFSGYSAGGHIVACLARLAHGADPEQLADALHSTERMSAEGRRAFIADMQDLAPQLPKTGYYVIASPQNGLKGRRFTGPIQSVLIDPLNPHLIPCLGRDYLCGARAGRSSALTGQILTADSDPLPWLKDPVLASMLGVMTVLYSLTDQPVQSSSQDHDRIVSRETCFVPGVPFVDFAGDHTMVVSSEAGGAALLELIRKTS